MTEEERGNFNIVEAKELFLTASWPDPEMPPEKLTTKTLERTKKKRQRDNEPNIDPAQEGKGTPKPEVDSEKSLSITSGDFWNMFRKWKKSTTSSPLGRHIVNYRVIMGNNDLV